MENETPEAAGAAGAGAGAAVDAPRVPAEAQRPDPLMQQLVAAQRELETLRKDSAAQAAKIKQHERDAKKGAVLNTLYDEFPALKRDEIRGAAYVAAEDGLVDLYADDAASKLKALLSERSKRTDAPPSRAAAPAPSLGGTPGTAGRPANGTPRLPI